MIPLEEARCFVLDSCTRLEPERVVVEDAIGCALAEVIVATEAVPPFANSAMDGYALRAGDVAESFARLRVVGSVMAGDVPSAPLLPGEALRIMTGAPVPEGADAVCMIERTRDEGDGSFVVIESSVAVGENVRPAGGDISLGSEVFLPGTAVTPEHVGVLASLGVESVLVRPRPRIGVISTGDELATSPGQLLPGTIRDSNRPSLLAKIRQDGWEGVDLGVVRDDEDSMAKVFDQAASTCNALVTSGGVSVGDRDLVKEVLGRLSNGSMRWMQVAIKPAKPFAFGVVAETGTPLFGLPGNPVSALVSYELFVRPAVRAMCGHQILDRPVLSAVAGADFTRERDGKLHLVRSVAIADASGTVEARPSGGQGSHMLRSMAHANAFALLPDGEGVAAGERVTVMITDLDRLASVPGAMQQVL